MTADILYSAKRFRSIFDVAVHKYRRKERFATYNISAVINWLCKADIVFRKARFVAYNVSTVIN